MRTLIFVVSIMIIYGCSDDVAAPAPVVDDSSWSDHVERAKQDACVVVALARQLDASSCYPTEERDPVDVPDTTGIPHNIPAVHVAPSVVTVTQL